MGDDLVVKQSVGLFVNKGKKTGSVKVVSREEDILVFSVGGLVGQAESVMLRYKFERGTVKYRVKPEFNDGKYSFINWETVEDLSKAKSIDIIISDSQLKESIVHSLRQGDGKKTAYNKTPTGLKFQRFDIADEQETMKGGTVGIAFTALSGFAFFIFFTYLFTVGGNLSNFGSVSSLIFIVLTGVSAAFLVLFWLDFMNLIKAAKILVVAGPIGYAILWYALNGIQFKVLDDKAVVEEPEKKKTKKN